MAVKKILLIQTASIGDVILATSILEKLHAFYPEAKLDYLVKMGMEGLFTGHPFLHEILLWDKGTNKYSNLWDIARTIRKNRYDAVINVQRFGSSGFLTAFSGADLTIGFNKNPLSLFFTRRIKHRIGPCIHEINRAMDLVFGITDDTVVKPKLYPPETSKEGIYYTISPASLWFTKQYPKERWIDLVRCIDRRSSVYLLGSRSDRPLCEEIMYSSSHPNCHNLAGEISLLESAGLMKGARMNFTNDSAPMHLASAVDAPVTAVYCSTIPEFGFGPLSSDSAVIEIDQPLYCRPCGLHGLPACPEKHFRCALDIDVNRLTARL